MLALYVWLAQMGYDDAFYFGPSAGYGAGGGDDYTGIGLILVLVCMLLGWWVQYNLSSKMKRFFATPAPLTGAETALRMLRENGLGDVRITCVKGQLTDHYNPLNRTVNLSEDVYHAATVASMAVAAHECGHAVQHAHAYPWMGLRSSMVPMVNIGSRMGQMVLMLGLVLLGAGSGATVAWIGLGLYATTTLFALVTLPVEFDASRRALAWMKGCGLADRAMHGNATSALRAAAMTYVSAALSSLAMLLYYAFIILARSNRNNRN